MDNVLEESRVKQTEQGGVTVVQMEDGGLTWGESSRIGDKKANSKYPWKIK